MTLMGCLYKLRNENKLRREFYMNKKTVAIAFVLLAVIAVGVAFAVDTSKLSVYKTSDTTFVVKNITNRPVRNIVVVVDVQYGPNSTRAGSVGTSWKRASLAGGQSITVDIFNDLSEGFLRGAKINKVSLYSCD
jgi:hypothetical protein